MASYDLETFVRSIENLGLTEVLLPFLLFFTVIYAILTKTKMLGEEKRQFNIIVALVIALTPVILHVTHRSGTVDAVDIINKALPSVSIVVIAVIMFFILIGLFFGEQKFAGASVGGWITVVSFLAIVLIFGGAAGWWTSSLYHKVVSTFGPDAVTAVIIILVFGIIIVYITGDDKKQPGERMFDSLGKFFGGQK